MRDTGNLMSYRGFVKRILASHVTAEVILWIRLEEIGSPPCRSGVGGGRSEYMFVEQL